MEETPPPISLEQAQLLALLAQGKCITINEARKLIPGWEPLNGPNGLLLLGQEPKDE